MSLKHICIVAGLTALATAAHGQDGTEVTMNRTPANAQKFLAATPPEMFSSEQTFSQRIGDITSPEACTTAMSGTRVEYIASTYKYEAKTVAYRAYMGVQLEGRRIIGFLDDSFAKAAGLRKGDEIVSIGATPIGASDDVNVALTAELAAGKPKAEVAYVRNGVSGQASVQMGKADDQIFIPLPTAPVTLTIEWGQVEAVGSETVNGRPYVSLTTPGDPKSRYKLLLYSVAATRDRVMAAAKYLQQACDRSKELGF